MDERSVFDPSLFFEPEPLLMHENRGFDMYGPEHAVALVACIFFIWLLTRRYLRLPQGMRWGSERRSQLLAMAVAPLALLASRDLIMVVEGCFSDFYLPLHSCNICEFIDLAYVIWPTAWLGDIVFTLGFLGGVAALLMCGWSYCPIWSYASVGGFVEHSLLVAFALCITLGRDFEPDERRIWRPILFTTVMGLLARVFNSFHGTNFCFVSWPVGGTPLELFYDWFGNPGYLVPYAIGVFLCFWVLYRLYDLASSRFPSRGPGGSSSGDDSPNSSQNAFATGGR
jgi:hypothetical integral membrane protein (TIGR02206 family)